jgi:hypothetical protein
MPISWMSVTYDVDLERRSLPSTGVTGFACTADLSATQGRQSLPGVRLRITRPHCVGFISVYRHAVVNTPVARWALIARGTAYSTRLPVPCGGGLSHIPARSANTLDFSRLAQLSLAITACRLAESPRRPVCRVGSDGFVTCTVAPIATGSSDPVSPWDLHPLKI